GAEKLIVELGTGWYPVIPILFHLTDTGKVISFDLQNWLRKEGHLSVIRKLKEWRENEKLQSFFPHLNEEKWEALQQVSTESDQFSLEDLNRHIGLQAVVGDAARSGLPAQGVDFICSNNTFEHIFPAALRSILMEYKRIAKPGAVMSHFVDLSDHFAHFDPSLTIYNFLRFSKKSWSIIDNRIQPQNRLRWKDYLALYQDLDLPITEESIRKGDLTALASVPVHEEFAAYTPEELAISHGYLVSQIG
ncbi:MAG: class I SAM-dependent methyltransferase, partial [Bacteroidota bacterium]